MNYFVILKYLPLLFQIVPQLLSAEANLSNGQPVTITGVRTYIPDMQGKQAHVEVDLVIRPLDNPASPQQSTGTTAQTKLATQVS